MPFRSFAADDIFISYTRLDASTYAAGLADELTKKGFSCFIDKLGTDPDKDLPEMLRRKIRSCAMLVIVGTERAGARPTIEAEVREFLLSGRRSSIVPIDFGGAVYEARWYGLVEGIAPEPEKNAEALDDGEPSPSVVSRIEKQFKYRRRDQRLRRATIGTAALLALLLLASVAASVYAAKQLDAAREADKAAKAADRAAREAGARAVEAGARAMEAGARAEQARAEADVARGEATAAKTEAGAARDDATKQKALADRATLDAEAKTRLADEAARRAAAAEKLARAAEAEGERQQTIADSRSVASRSQTILRQRPDEVPRSVSLAVKALKTARTVEADTALRESLALLPRLSRPGVPYEGDINDTALSPDGRHFATLSSDNMLRVYESGVQTPLKGLPCECSTLALSNGPAFAAALTPSGIEIFNLKNDDRRTIKVEDGGPTKGGASGEAVPEEAPSGEGSVRRIAISPGGRYVALTFDVGEDVGRVSRVRLLDAATGKVVQTLLEESSLKANDLAFGASGNLAVAGSELGPHGRPVGRAVIWTLSDRLGQGEADAELTAADFALPIDVYQDYEIKAIAPGADDSYLATDRAVLKRYARREYEPVARLPLPAGEPPDSSGATLYAVENVSFNASGDRLTVVRRYPTMSFGGVRAEEQGSNKSLEEWETSGHWEAARFPLLSEAANVALLTDDDHLIFASDSDPSSSLQLFRAPDGSGAAATVRTESLQAGFFDAEAIPRFLTVGEGTAEVWGGRGKMIPLPFSADLREVIAGARTPDGKFLVLAGRSVGFYALEGGAYRLVRLLPVPEPVSKVALTPDGQTLVTQTRETRHGTHAVQVWRTSDGLEITPTGLRGFPLMTAWRLSPGGHFLAVSGHGRAAGGGGGAGVYVWRLTDGAPLAPLLSTDYMGPRPLLSFSPRERFLLSAGEGVTHLLELPTGRVRDVPADAAVTVAAFSEDERHLGVGTDEGLLLVYPTEDLDNEVARLRHEGRLGAVAFSADGRRLVTESQRSNPYRLNEANDSPLRVWLLRPEDLLEEAEKRLAGLPAYAL